MTNHNIVKIFTVDMTKRKKKIRDKTYQIRLRLIITDLWTISFGIFLWMNSLEYILKIAVVESPNSELVVSKSWRLNYYICKETTFSNLLNKETWIKFTHKELISLLTQNLKIISSWIFILVRCVRSGV